MAEKYEHEYEGYHWEREEDREQTIEGFLKFEDGEIIIEGDSDGTPIKPGSEETNLINKLRYLGSGTEVRITIKSWNWEEVEETTDFDPFDHLKEEE